MCNATGAIAVTSAKRTSGGGRRVIGGAAVVDVIAMKIPSSWPTSCELLHTRPHYEAGRGMAPRKRKREMAIRTGEELLQSLRDDRLLFIDGARVGDVTTDTRFAGAARILAERTTPHSAAS